MKKQTLLSVALSLLLFSFQTANAQTVLIEAESFQNPGGWSPDQQAMHEMGSPYLLAHGLGTPVADATTTVSLPATGKYRLWVRTKDWVAQWKAPGAPGKFSVSINQVKSDTIFGTKFASWSWQNGGVIAIPQKDIQIRLTDLTGFEGRCDAIVLCKDTTFVPPHEAAALATWRTGLLGNGVARRAGQFDLVVVGGGMAGTAAAIGASRLGLKVALVQDRPVVGGNNSKEVMVGLGGAINISPYTNIGNVIKELIPPVDPMVNPDSALNDEYRMNILRAEKNLTLFMNTRADGVTMNGRKIESVVAQNTVTAERIELFGSYFADCTGDGTIGFLAGADYEINLQKHMGNTNMWRVKSYSTPQPFPKCPWAIDLTNKPFPGRPGIKGPSNTSGLGCLGSWFWESGFSRNPLTEVEYIRDYNLRAMYGAWDCLKNVDMLYPNYKLFWAAYITGKRESRRLLGDVQLTKEDLLGSVKYKDGFVGVGWNMDVHVPHSSFLASFEGDEFISIDLHTDFKRPYYVPYRCFYSRNTDNLFMAGRNISVTQEALGSVRVMKTTGLMGEVVGLAAGLCVKRHATPRELYTTYFNELSSYIISGIPAFGDTMVAKPFNYPDSKNLQILVDNSDPGCTFDTPWATSVYVAGYVGDNYTQDGNTGADPNKWAKWTPTLPEAGRYKVYMNWAEGGGRPTNAPVEIHHADSISHTTIDQTKNGGVWYYLGTFRFDAGNTGFVKLLASATGSTIADAVLFEKTGAPVAVQPVVDEISSLTVCGGEAPAVVVNLKKEARVSVDLLSVCGVCLQPVVSELRLPAQRHTFDLSESNLSRGIYLVRLMIDGKAAGCKKLIVK